MEVEITTRSYTDVCKYIRMADEREIDILFLGWRKTKNDSFKTITEVKAIPLQGEYSILYSSRGDWRPSYEKDGL